MAIKLDLTNVDIEADQIYLNEQYLTGPNLALSKIEGEFSAENTLRDPKQFDERRDYATLQLIDIDKNSPIKGI